MGKLKIGRLYIKPLYLALLIVGLLLVVGGAIALINYLNYPYEYVYRFKETDIEGVKDIEFSSFLAKGEVIRGKLVVESGEAILLITAEEEREERVVDSGRIQAGKTFRFSLRSDWTPTQYNGKFSFTSDANARFYCNLDPSISGGYSISATEKPRVTSEWATVSIKEYEYFDLKSVNVEFIPAKLR